MTSQILPLGNQFRIIATMPLNCSKGPWQQAHFLKWPQCFTLLSDLAGEQWKVILLMFLNVFLLWFSCQEGVADC